MTDKLTLSTLHTETTSNGMDRQKGNSEGKTIIINMGKAEIITEKLQTQTKKNAF